MPLHMAMERALHNIRHWHPVPAPLGLGFSRSILSGTSSYAFPAWATQLSVPLHIVRLAPFGHEGCCVAVTLAQVSPGKGGYRSGVARCS